MTRRRLAIAFAVTTTAAALTLSGCSTPAAPPPTPVTPIASCISAAEQRDHGLTLTRPDGIKVDALHYGSGATGIVFANQVDIDLCGWQPYAAIMVQKGYQTIVFNYSGRDKSSDDVLAAGAELRRQGVTRVFLIGASKGGTAVLAAAAEAQPPVSGVVSLSGPAAYGATNAQAEMGQLTVPALFVVGEYDTDFVPAAHSLYDAAASTDKQLVIRQNPRHGVALLDTDTVNLIETFIAQHAAM
jgi:pimeloyl-ACP methyl ester carboxylesterase